MHHDPKNDRKLIVRHNAECHALFFVMLNVMMLNVVMLNVIMLNVIMLNVDMLNVDMLSVIMLSANKTLQHGLL